MKKLLILLLLYALVLPSCNERDTDDVSCLIPKSEDAYDYPIKPGSEEWKQLRSCFEMNQI